MLCSSKRKPVTVTFDTFTHELTVEGNKSELPGFQKIIRKIVKNKLAKTGFVIVNWADVTSTSPEKVWSVPSLPLPAQGHPDFNPKKYLALLKGKGIEVESEEEPEEKIIKTAIDYWLSLHDIILKLDEYKELPELTYEKSLHLLLSSPLPDGSETNPLFLRWGYILNSKLKLVQNFFKDMQDACGVAESGEVSGFLLDHKGVPSKGSVPPHQDKMVDLLSPGEGPLQNADYQVVTWGDLDVEGGEFQLFDAISQNLVATIKPEENRMVFFDGRLFHGVRPLEIPEGKVFCRRQNLAVLISGDSGGSETTGS